MTLEELQREIAVVRQRRWPIERASRFFQIDFSPRKPVWRDYEFWMNQRSNPNPLLDDSIDRWWFEMFLQTRGLIPCAWMALRLGMLPESLKELRNKMDEKGPFLSYHISPDLIGKTFEQDLVEQFPQYRNRTFNDHDDYCNHLHDWLQKIYGITILPAICETSRLVGRGTDFAKFWDILTMEPLSPRYQVWLDFGKWMTLAPDRCSVLVFASHREELTFCLAGTEPPEIPSEVAKLVPEPV